MATEEVERSRVDLQKLPDLIVSESQPEGSGSAELGPPITTWTDESGRPIGRSGLAGEVCWIELHGVGIYRFRVASGEVEAVPAQEASREIVVDSYRRSILPHVLQARGTEVLHASAFTVGGEVVGLCGVSGVGKSTLAHGLTQKGYSPWADDALAMECTGSRCVTFPLPFRFRLSGHAAANALAPIEVAEPGSMSPLRVRALVLLRRLEEPAPQDVDFLWNRYEPADAFRALLPHAYWLDVGDTDHRRLMIETYLRIAEKTPIFECAFFPDIERFADLVGRLEDAVNEI